MSNYLSFEISPPSKIRRIHFRSKRGEFFFETLTISCRGGVGDTWETRAELAGREGLALLFLAEEGRHPHGIPELSWWVERGWPHYFLQRRDGRHMGDQS